jgi:predicted nucleic-acid-binding protein
VSGFLDTNVLIRHLTGDPPAMSKRATAFLREASELYLTDLVVAETIYVLDSYYEVPREQIATTIRSLLAFNSISVVDRDVLLRAVEVYEIDRLDFAEAYLLACAESTGIGRVVSFDRSIERVSSIERVEP